MENKCIQYSSQRLFCLSSLVTCEEEDSLVPKIIHDGIRDFLAKKMKKENISDETKQLQTKSNQLVSFPNMEKQKTLTRLKPMGSPTKYSK